MMAPVFSRAAWRCVWYMIQVLLHSVLLIHKHCSILFHISSQSVVCFTE